MEADSACTTILSSNYFKETYSGPTFWAPSEVLHCYFQCQLGQAVSSRRCCKLPVLQPRVNFCCDSPSFDSTSFGILEGSSSLCFLGQKCGTSCLKVVVYLTVGVLHFKESRCQTISYQPRFEHWPQETLKSCFQTAEV